MSDEVLQGYRRELERHGLSPEDVAAGLLRPGRFQLLTRVKASEKSVRCGVWVGRRDYAASGTWYWRTPVATIAEVMALRDAMFEPAALACADPRLADGLDRLRAYGAVSLYDSERREILNLVEGMEHGPAAVVDGEEPSPPPSDGHGRFIAWGDGSCPNADLDNNNQAMRVVGAVTRQPKVSHPEGALLVCDMLIGEHPCGAAYTTQAGLDEHQGKAHEEPGALRAPGSVTPTGTVRAIPRREGHC